MSDKLKRAARTLQARTGWPYQTCRRLVVRVGPDDVEYVDTQSLAEILHEMNLAGD